MSLILRLQDFKIFSFVIKKYFSVCTDLFEYQVFEVIPANRVKPEIINTFCTHYCSKINEIKCEFAYNLPN